MNSSACLRDNILKPKESIQATQFDFSTDFYISA